MENLVKLKRVVFEICEQTDRQTNRQTDTLITILCTHTGGEIIILFFFRKVLPIVV